MKVSRAVWFLLFVLLALSTHSSHHEQPVTMARTGLSDPTSKTRAQINESYGRLPLSFEANQGQAASDVKFLSRGNGYLLYLTATDAVLQLPGQLQSGHKTRPTAQVKMKLVNANPASRVTGHEQLPGKSNYFIGSDLSKWRTNISHYKKVEYQQVWPGVNLVYYGNQRQLEYDFVVAPGANPRAIKLSFEGAEKVEVDPQGHLVLRVEGGNVVLRRPFVYQDVDGRRKEIESAYVLDGKDGASFQVATYDIERALVIDPVLTYATYLGGLSDDSAYGIAVDSQRNVYVAGLTSSSDFPRVSPLQPNFGGGDDVFVTKINASGSAILYSTYIGGNGADAPGDLAVDATGNAYLTGMTGSTNFPTASPFQATRSGLSDAFVTKLNASGSALLYSTYFGGSGGESGRDIAVNSTGNIFVLGTTASTNLPRAQPFQADFGGGQADVFITKFNPAGSGLIYSTYFGGSGVDAANGLALDASDNVYITGDTSSSNLPKVNPAQPTYGSNGDGFVARLEASGSTLGYSTYLGGSGEDSAQAIAVDAAGNAYVTGETSSGNFPTLNALQASKGSGSDAFVTKLAAAGTIVYSTFLGGSNSGFNDSDAGSGIAVDSGGSVLVTGYTTSPNFPNANPIQANNNGGGEAFVTKLNAAGSALVYSTFLGGTGYDSGEAIAVDTVGGAYIAGQTRSTNFPTKDPIQPGIVSSGAYDAFIVKISDGETCPPALVAEVSADILAFSNVIPSNDPPLLGANLKRDGLRATVTWLLESQPDAILVVQLFDQEGNIRGDAGSIEVKKPTQCPPPSSSQDFVFIGSTVDLLPRNGVEVTDLKLSAIMSGGGGQVIKRVDLNYRLFSDIIAFEGTPKINGADAPDGSQLPSSGSINFTSPLRYRLANDVNGKIRLQAFDANGGGQIASKDLSPAVAPATQSTIWNTALDFQFTVPPNVNEISVVASLLAENGTLLKTSTPLFYRNKPRIVLGAQYEGGSFVPYTSNVTAIAGSEIHDRVEVGGLALKFRDDLPPSLTGSRFVVLLKQSLNDGTLIRGPQAVRHKKIDDFPRPSFILLIDGAFPDDADKWEFEVLLRPPNEAPQVASDIATLPINRLRIKTLNPLQDRPLLAGTEQEFVVILAHNTTPAVTIMVEYTYILTFGQTKDSKGFTNGTKPPNNYSTGEQFRFSLMLPPNLRQLEFRFYAVGSEVSSKTKSYRRIDPPPIQIPTGATDTIKSLGVDVTPVQNGINRLIKAGRKANNTKNSVLEGIGLLPRPSPPNANGALLKVEIGALTPVALLRDFIGINANWEFDPPIPANGSFIADLKFYYSADELPDDPNFNESAMKIISFDPATGTLESLPTTLDLTAKTATTRVNGLRPMYSLGVTGPFAHRTLNFPLLRSLDDFITQLTLSNFGGGEAVVNSRAYKPTGGLYNSAGIENPTSATLSAGRTLTGSVAELFELPGEVDGGWMQTHANKNFVAGSQLLGKDTRLDAMGLPPFYAGTQVLTDVRYDAVMTTEIHIANVTNFSTNLILDLRTTTGTLADSYETSLTPKETFAYRVQDIFATLTQPFAGYIIVRGDSDLAAATLQVYETEIAALNGQVALPGSAATKLYGPYVLTDGTSITTRLNLVNPTTSTANLTLRFVNSTGANLAAPVNLQLASGQQSQREVSQIFSLNPGNLVFGALIIESSIAGVVGDLSYSSPSVQFKFRASLPLESEPAKFLAFGHLDNRAASFTELGIFNPGTQAAQVQVRVLRADGTETGKTTVQVAAGAKFSDFLDAVVGPSFGQVGGSFTLSSDQPIVAGAAFGPLSGTTLSALQPQSFDPATFTRAQASVSAASYLGPDLAAESIVAAFGVNLATATQLATSAPLPIDLAGTTVRVRDSAGVERLAPLFFVSGGQINYQLPSGTALGAATITIASGDGTLSTGTVNVISAAPGLFSAASSGSGVAAAYIVRVKNDNSTVDELISRYDAAQQKFVAIPIEFTPETRDIVLVLFGTGWRGRSALAAVGVKIGGVDVPVAYAGPQGGFVGLDQMNVTLSRSLIGRGEVDIVVTVDGKIANTVRANVK